MTARLACATGVSGSTSHLAFQEEITGTVTESKDLMAEAKSLTLVSPANEPHDMVLGGNPSQIM